MQDTGVTLSRKLGWILFIGGLLVAFGIGVFAFLFGTEASLLQKLLVIVIYGGLFGLFYSVLRQRLIERKTDRYKDVEI